MKNNIPRVLIAEDNRLTLQILGKLVGKMGYDTCLVEDGYEAMRQLPSFGPDLVLIDVSMPKLDGYEACVHLRKLCKPHVPIIFLSGKTRKEDILKGYEVGGSDFISKPFNHHELTRKIQIAVEGKLNIDRLAARGDSYKSSQQDALIKGEAYKIVEAFIQQSFHYERYDELVTGLKKTLRGGFGLRYTLQVRLEDFSVNHSDDGVVSPIDLQIIESCKEEGRMFEFRVDRTLWTYKKFSLLVHNIGAWGEDVTLLLDTFQQALERIKSLQAGTDAFELFEIGVEPSLPMIKKIVRQQFEHLVGKVSLHLGDHQGTYEFSKDFEEQLVGLVNHEKKLILEKK